MALINGITVDGSLIQNTLGGIGGLFKDIRSAITGKIDPEKEAAIAIKIQEIDNQLLSAQTEINKIEAQHPNIFVSGWRPCVGWLCCVGLAYEFFLHPILEWISINFHCLAPPPLDTSLLSTLVISMLGMGIMRTAEKIKGVARN